MSHTFAVSRIFSASPLHVASWFRDFSNMHRWHPDVVRCRSSGDTRRVLEMSNGDEVVERLLERDAHSIRYDILASPHPLVRYVAELDVVGHEAGALVTWSVDFEATSQRAQELLAAGMRDFFERGLEGLAMVSSQEVR